MILLGIFEISEAKRLIDLFTEKEIEAQLRNNEETCKKGCRVVMEVWIDENKAQDAITILKNEAIATLNSEGLTIDLDLLNGVYDPEQENAICPACGLVFMASSLIISMVRLVFSFSARCLYTPSRIPEL